LTTDRKAARERRKEVLKALAGVMAGMFVAMTSLTIVATALPTMIKDLHGSQSAYTWVITGALLASTIGTVIAGKLADQFHKKTLLMWGFGIFIVGSLLSGFSWNTEILVVFRAIQGVGMGFQMALTGAVIASVISPRERGKYNGYMGAVMAVATVSGPLFGGFIVDLWGWRWCFWVAVPFTLIAMLIVHRKLEVPPAPKRKPKIDYLGSVLITVGVTLFMLWMTEASNEFSWDDWRLWILLVVSLIVLTIFVFWEKRAAEPLIPFEVLNTPITRLAVITSIMLGVSQNTVSIFMGQYFQLGRGYTPTVSGLGMLPISIGALVASTVAGYLVSSSGKWKPAVVTGMALLTGGSIMLIFIGDNTPTGMWLPAWRWLVSAKVPPCRTWCSPSKTQWPTRILVPPLLRSLSPAPWVAALVCRRSAQCSTATSLTTSTTVQNDWWTRVLTPVPCSSSAMWRTCRC